MKQNSWMKFRKWYLRVRISKSAQLNIVWGFFLYAAIGFFLLSLPFVQKESVSLLDNLFIATSAISTTGLVTVSVFDSYNFFGQFVVMCLFQVGGVGYMTLTGYFLLTTTKTLTKFHQGILEAEFSMPNTIKVNDFIKAIFLFTLILETLGAICFFIAFKMAGVETGFAVWSSIYHSVSAFCTAGFGLYNDSFESFKDNAFLNIIISTLAICGSLGFIVVTDLYYLVTRKSKELSFTTKIIFYGFLALLFVGTTLIYFTEPLVHQGEGSALIKSFFQAMTAMTTVGFNTIATGDLSLAILLFVTFLMYIGASPSGTAGGMKITTLTAMASVVRSKIQGAKTIHFLGKKIPEERLDVATATFVSYTALIFFATFLLSFTEKQAFEKILFEVASALGTVGLSTGITGDLTSFGKAVIIGVMFIGRVGVLTFGFALLQDKNAKLIQEESDIAV